jgi:uncharacterized protein with HEPN domain
VRNDRERLLDIIEAIERIERHVRGGRAAIADQELVQVWVIHNLEIVGEAARGVSEDLRRRRPDVPWRAVVAMRNVLAHGYFGIDVERVWATVEKDLPKLKEQIRSIVAEMPAEVDESKRGD